VAVAPAQLKVVQPAGPAAVVATARAQAEQVILHLHLRVKEIMEVQERLNPEHMVQVVVEVQAVQEQLELLLSAELGESEQYQRSSLQTRLLLMQ
jgi:hypothetical protein